MPLMTILMDETDKQVRITQQAMNTWEYAQLRADSDDYNVQTRADDGLGILKEQLTYYDPRVMEEEYQDYDYADPAGLVPHNPTEMPGLEIIKKRFMTRIGQWQLMGDRTTTLDSIDVTQRDVTYGSKAFGAKIEYTPQELRKITFAQANGNFAPVADLISQKMSAVRETYKKLINDVNSLGFPSLGVYGLHTHPNIPRSVSPYALGSARTADENIAVLTMMVNTILANSRQVRAAAPDTLILPIGLAQELNLQTRSTSSDISTLQFFLKNNKYIKGIESTPECDTFIHAYKRDASRLEAMIPMKMRQTMPITADASSGVYTTRFACEVSGVHVSRPYDHLILEGAYAA